MRFILQRLSLQLHGIHVHTVIISYFVSTPVYVCEVIIFSGWYYTEKPSTRHHTLVSHMIPVTDKLVVERQYNVLADSGGDASKLSHDMSTELQSRTRSKPSMIASQKLNTVEFESHCLLLEYCENEGERDDATKL